MRFLFGFIFTLVCIGVGYGAHGDFKVLWQPLEVLIIAGSAIGSFIIANPGYVIKDTLKSLKYVMRGAPYKVSDYLELLTFLFSVFKLARTKGMLELESHIENPNESQLFLQYPKVLGNHHAVEFFCDNLRLLTMGFDNAHQMEDLMNEDIELHHHEVAEPSHAISKMADAFPALGIVAAVLGVIITMGSITEPPEILGKLIGAALVGTFLGVLLAYGVIGPIAAFLGIFAGGQTQYFNVMKAGILAHMRGNAPVISVEFARKAISGHFRPGFKEVDEALNKASGG